MSEFDDDRPEEGGAEAAPPETPSPAPAPAAAALREDQLQNAVAFLSHPKVRSSSVASKREFLQRKGLTEAEIDEAYRRVPEQPAAVPVVPAAPSPVQSTLQHLQPQAQPAPQQQLAYAQPQQQLQQQPYAQQQQAGYGPGPMVPAQQQLQQQPGVRWTQAVLGAGFLAASAYAAKSLLWPYMEGAYYSWRGHVRPPPRPLLAGADARNSQATQAMADAIAAQTTELRTSIDAIKRLVAAMEAAQQAQQAAASPSSRGAVAAGDEDGALTVSDLRQELRSFAETLHELASPTPAAASAAVPAPAKLESELGEIKTLLTELLRSPRSSGSHSPPPALPGSRAAAAGDGATPLSAGSTLWPGIAPQAAAEDSSSSAAPAGGQEDGEAQPQANGLGSHHPEEQLRQQQQDGEHVPGQQEHEMHTPQRSQHGTPAVEGDAAADAPDGTAEEASRGADVPPVAPPHPASYMEVLEMLEKGQTPPGIRTDINDKPPNPLAAPPAPKMKPRPKPWELGSPQQGNGAAAGSLVGSLAGGAGGSSSSLGSLPAAPASGTPLAGAAASSAEPAAGEARVQAQESAEAEAATAPLQVPSLVRAPSPAEEAAAGAAAPPQRDVQQQQQQGQGSPVRGPSSFKRATSIYEAVAPPPDSPHIIAGRLSPGRPDSLARSGDSSSLGGAAGKQAAATGDGGTFAALLVQAQERANAAASVLSASTEGVPVPAPLEGSGIGRPSSRNWKPPPIPAPTLGGGSGSSSSNTPGLPPAGSMDGGAAAPSGAAAAGGAHHPAAGSGMAGGGARALSAASLGEDFASA